MVAKLFKLLFRIVLIAVFILVACIGLLVVYINPNDYKEVVIEGVKDKTGRELSIPGDISFSFYPWLGVKLGEVSISNAPGFAGDSFAKISALDVRLSVKQLLNFQPELGVLYLDGLDVTLIKRADGTTNWDDLMAANQQAASAQPEAEIAIEDPEATSLDDLLKQLAIASFEINNANVTWQDDSSNTNIALKDFNLSTGTIRLTAPVQYEMSFQTVLNQPALEIDIFSSGRITLKPDLSDITLNSLLLSADLTGDIIPAGEQNVTLTGNVIYSVQDSLLNLIDLSVEAANAQAIVDVKVSDIDTAPQVQGKVIVPAFAPRETLQQLAIDLPEMADARALQSLAMQMDVEVNDRQQRLTNMRVELDGSTLTGGVNIQPGNITRINYQFNVDELDVDRYLPPPTETADASASANNTPAEDVPLNLPVDLIRKLNVDGEFAATRIKAMNLNFRDVIARNVVRSNIAQLNLVAEKFYAGKIDLLASIDARAATPAVSAEAELANVSIGSILKDFNDTDFISGEGNLNLNVRSLAQTSQQLMKSMNGLVSFSFTDGEVTGINIAEQLRRVEAITKGEQYVQSREVNSTDFAAITGGGSIRNGVYTWTSLNLQAPLLRATAKGNIDIGEQTFATDFDAYFVNTKSGQAGKNIDDVRSLRVPVRLGGTFSEPKLSVAPNFLRSIGGKVDEVITEKKEQISNAVSEATQAQRDAAAAKLAEQKAQLDAQRAAAAAKLKAAQDAAKEKAKDDAKNSLLEKLR